MVLDKEPSLCAAVNRVMQREQETAGHRLQRALFAE